jgi:hypothetical protein
MNEPAHPPEHVDRLYRVLIISIAGNGAELVVGGGITSLKSLREGRTDE